jgi:hypothetical protein
MPLASPIDVSPHRMHPVLYFNGSSASQPGMTGQPCSPLTPTAPSRESMTHNNKPTFLTTESRGSDSMLRRAYNLL